MRSLHKKQVRLSLKNLKENTHIVKGYGNDGKKKCIKHALIDGMAFIESNDHDSHI